MEHLFYFYRWIFVAGGLLGVALAVLGAHLASRDKSVQSICVSQGAVLGVLLALGIQGTDHADPFSHGLPLALSFLFSGLAYFFGNRLTRKREASKNTFFIGLFAVLSALGSFVSALFPALESHMSQVYFGDLATLSDFDAKFCAIAAVLALLLLTRKMRGIVSGSFNSEILGSRGLHSGKGALFDLTALVLLSLSVQWVGFLFTIALLFLPTIVMSMTRVIGLRRHLAGASLIAFVATQAGLFISLRWSRFPTVPTIAVVIIGMALPMIVSKFAGQRR